MKDKHDHEVCKLIAEIGRLSARRGQKLAFVAFVKEDGKDDSVTINATWNPDIVEYASTHPSSPDMEQLVASVGKAVAILTNGEMYSRYEQMQKHGLTDSPANSLVN